MKISPIPDNYNYWGVGAGLVKFTSAGEGHTFQTFGKLNEKLCFSPGYTLGTLY